MNECWPGFHTFDVEMAIDDLKQICALIRWNTEKSKSNIFAKQKMPCNPWNFCIAFSIFPFIWLDDVYDRLQWAGEEYILEELDDEVKGLGKAGITYSQEVMYWAGYTYRYWHYYTNECSREIYKTAERLLISARSVISPLKKRSRTTNILSLAI